MKMQEELGITSDEVAKAFSLFKHIEPSLQYAPQMWSKERKIEKGHYYYYKEKNIFKAVWCDFENITEINFKKIYRKINIISHEFFIYHYDNKTRIGWRLRNKI